ncbi:MAG: hypothetical protein ACRDAW_01250 [Metamycoplasmataceae bacterium]
MKTETREKFSKIPAGLTGVGLGMAGLGSVWTALINSNVSDKVPDHILSVLQYFSISFTIFFLVLIFIKVSFNKNILKQEISHPLISSFLPTIFMSLMLVGGFIASISKLAYDSLQINALTIIGAIIWYIAVLGHFVILSSFLYFVVRKHKVKEEPIYASWFIPPVGIIVSCLVVPFFPTQLIPTILFQIIWFFGFSLYLIAFPLITFKLLFNKNKQEWTLPSIGIFAAPANLSLSGFVSCFIGIKDGSNQYTPLLNYYDMTFVYNIIIVLTFLAITSTFVVYLILPKILLMKFNPTFASLTFPLAVGATSTSLVTKVIFSAMGQNPYLIQLHLTISIISYIELIMATLIISYVLVRYLMLLYSIFWKR